MCVDMKVHGNPYALYVYDNIINNPYRYPELKDAVIHSVINDGRVGNVRH